MAVRKASSKEKTPVKAIETKKDTTKAIETRAAVLKEAAPAEKTKEKAVVKKAAAKKAAPVKKAASTKALKKVEPNIEMFLQFTGKEYTEQEIFQKVKEIWTKTLRQKVGDMQDVKIYLKPEESAAYYVINGDTTGRVDL